MLEYSRDEVRVWGALQQIHDYFLIAIEQLARAECCGSDRAAGAGEAVAASGDQSPPFSWSSEGCEREESEDESGAGREEELVSNDENSSGVWSPPPGSCSSAVDLRASC